MNTEFSANASPNSKPVSAIHSLRTVAGRGLMWVIGGLTSIALAIAPWVASPQAPSPTSDEKRPTQPASDDATEEDAR